VSVTVPEIRPTVDIWAIREIDIAAHKRVTSMQSWALRQFRADHFLQSIFKSSKGRLQGNPHFAPRFTL
jgi:hypothetical protein